MRHDATGVTTAALAPASFLHPPFRRRPLVLPLPPFSSPRSAPSGLRQHHYMVVEAPQKLDTLWSFVKSHLQQKTIVFCSSCKQVQPPSTPPSPLPPSPQAGTLPGGTCIR